MAVRKSISQVKRLVPKVPSRDPDQIQLVIKTRMGILRQVDLSPTIIKKLCNREPLPSFFLAGTELTDYLLDDTIEAHMRKTHGPDAAKVGIDRLRTYLESYKIKASSNKNRLKKNQLQLG